MGCLGPCFSNVVGIHSDWIVFIPFLQDSDLLVVTFSIFKYWSPLKVTSITFISLPRLYLPLSEKSFHVRGNKESKPSHLQVKL